jgi:Fe2+ transport system protein FeoA
LRFRPAVPIFDSRLKLILTRSYTRWLMLSRLFRKKAAPEAPCVECPLAACATGCKASVLRMECPIDDAHRLRGMGLFEGTCVHVIDSRNGMLLEVKGSRLALGEGLASAIKVLPLAS